MIQIIPLTTSSTFQAYRSIYYLIWFELHAQYDNSNLILKEINPDTKHLNRDEGETGLKFKNWRAQMQDSQDWREN